MDGGELFPSVLNNELDELDFSAILNANSFILKSSSLWQLLALTYLVECLSIGILAALDADLASSGNIKFNLCDFSLWDLNKELLRVESSSEPEGSEVSSV